jgi:membrane-bound lytic murein transglycosylase D
MKRSAFGLFFAGILAIGAAVDSAATPMAAYASPGYLNKTRTSQFAASPELRPRINFWIDVFTRYGKDEVVFHHRDYPGVTFGSLSFVAESGHLSPRKLENLKKSQKLAYEKRVMGAFQNLARGLAPKSSLEESIVSQMRFIPGGVKKYQRVVREKLVRSQTGIKERFADAIHRSGRYMPMLEGIFAEFDLPKELTRLPFVESSFDYKAYSSVGAAGIWQFMPRTGKIFGLRISSALDERRDPVEAGRAAAKYLKQAYSELGTWPLALTSYNHGVGGVKRAVRKMGTSDINRIIEHHGDRAFGFASNNFYPEFLAALEVYNNHTKYFPGLDIERPLNFDVIRLNNTYYISYLAKNLGVSIEDLRPLNYAISDATWKGRYPIPRGYNLKVPKGYGSRGSKLRAPEPIVTKKSLPQPRVSFTSKNVPKANTVNRPQQKVLPKYYRVRKGDTLWSISKRYGVSVNQIKALSGLRHNSIKVGQTLRLSR